MEGDALTRKVDTWLHQLLHHRCLYPPKIFEQQRKYGTPVYRAIHPEIQAYITHFVEAVESLLESENVKSVSLMVYEKEVVVEKFMFEIRSLWTRDQSKSLSSLGLADIEHYLRASMIKLSRWAIEVEPDQRRFSLSVETSVGQCPGLPEHWVPSEREIAYQELTPIQSTQLDVFSVNVLMMKASKKGKERKCY
ncbi:DNA-binding protein [Sporodiniella umbellata]|nr:DNA-binding protein [Sporodiniella umbellata]